MAIDYSRLKFAKGSPAVLVKRAKARAEHTEWQHTCRRVDERDKKVCQVTGTLLTGGAVDPWLALERHHLEFRSRNRSRRFNDRNIWTVSRAVHQLIHAGALRVLDKRGRPAADVREIDHVAWNRTLVARGEEPCRIRKGLPVRKDAA